MTPALLSRPPATEVAVLPDIEQLVAAGAAIAVGVSGGKDSQAAALATAQYLDRMRHQGPRVLVHADLGAVEWRESLPKCEELAAFLGYPLIVLRRAAGGLMERWEARWESSKRRYAQLETVALVLPWSTPAMRFCTSELKTSQITAELRRRFRGLPIINVTGVRRQESQRRARLPIGDRNCRASRDDAPFWDWRPLSDWSTEEVFACIADAGLRPHPAYTRFGSSRVSCLYCIMATAHDLAAATQAEESHQLYRRMVALETASTFAFQGSRWLGDVAPHLLDPNQRNAVAAAKDRARLRQYLESAIPPALRYVKGWPVRLPTAEEARLLARVRTEVARLIRLPIAYDTPESIIGRFAALLGDALDAPALPAQPETTPHLPGLTILTRLPNSPELPI